MPLNAPEWPLTAPRMAPDCPLSDPNGYHTRTPCQVHHTRTHDRSTTRAHHNTREHHARATTHEHMPGSPHENTCEDRHTSAPCQGQQTSTRARATTESTLPGPSHKKICQGHTGHHARAMSQAITQEKSCQGLHMRKHVRATTRHHDAQVGDAMRSSGSSGPCCATIGVGI